MSSIARFRLAAATATARSCAIGPSLQRTLSTASAAAAGNAAATRCRIASASAPHTASSLYRVRPSGAVTRLLAANASAAQFGAWPVPAGRHVWSGVLSRALTAAAAARATTAGIKSTVAARATSVVSVALPWHDTGRRWMSTYSTSTPAAASTAAAADAASSPPLWPADVVIPDHDTSNPDGSTGGGGGVDGGLDPAESWDRIEQTLSSLTSGDEYLRALPHDPQFEKSPAPGSHAEHEHQRMTDAHKRARVRRKATDEGVARADKLRNSGPLSRRDAEKRYRRANGDAHADATREQSFVPIDDAAPVTAKKPAAIAAGSSAAATTGLSTSAAAEIHAREQSIVAARTATQSAALQALLNRPGMTRDEQRLVLEQIANETKSYASAIVDKATTQKNLDRLGLGASAPPIRKLIDAWQIAVQRRLIVLYNEANSNAKSSRNPATGAPMRPLGARYYAPALLEAKVETVANIGLLTLMSGILRSLATAGPAKNRDANSVRQLALDIGKAISRDVNNKAMEEQAKAIARQMKLDARAQNAAAAAATATSSAAAGTTTVDAASTSSVVPDAAVAGATEPAAGRKAKGGLTAPQGFDPTSSRFHASSYFGHHEAVARNKLEVKAGSLPLWPQKTQLHVGVMVLQCILEVCFFVPPQQPQQPTKDGKPAGKQKAPAPPKAFEHQVHTLNRRGGKKISIGRVVLHSALEASIAAGVQAWAKPVQKPMLCVPRKWTSPTEGAYLTQSEPILRTRHQIQRSVLRAAVIPDVLAAINFVSAVPWRINVEVLAETRFRYRQGGGVCGLPALHDAPLPAPIDHRSPATTNAQRTAYQSELNKVKLFNKNQYSLRCDWTYRMDQAFEFQNRKFYFPLNLDWRGRAYPMPPHLNHLGSDVCRGLIRFADARPLGKTGLRWLKIHLANLYGKDKLPLDGREQWTTDNLQFVREAAQFPRKGGNDAWWQRAEDPWQCLACCKEIHAALRFVERGKGSIEEFPSSLPVHQDGSCNGLQHYAALGRDDWGGRAVNLFPADRPQDIYSGVLEHVIRQVDSDAASGKNPWAQFVVGKLTRKVVKQSVMTSVYGVTTIGARDQVHARLKERADITFELPNKAPFFDPKRPDQVLTPEQIRSKVAMYVATTVLNSLGALFKSAKAIMDWLREISSIIAGEGAVVAWTTPLGLPVVQPYCKSELMGTKTSLQSIYLEREDTNPVISFGRRAVAAENEARRAVGLQRAREPQKPSASISLVPPEDDGVYFGTATTDGSGPDAGPAPSSTSYIAMDAERAAVEGTDRDDWDADAAGGDDTGASPNGRRQRAAFPPNYVHSLDATHMMKTALECERRGITFASVHDSYWSHAGTMDEMNEALRNQFIELYSADLLGQLHTELQRRYNIVLPPPPPRGTLDLEQVRKSLYFFS